MKDVLQSDANSSDSIQEPLRNLQQNFTSSGITEHRRSPTVIHEGLLLFLLHRTIYQPHCPSSLQPGPSLQKKPLFTKVRRCDEVGLQNLVEIKEPGPEPGLTSR